MSTTKRLNLDFGSGSLAAVARDGTEFIPLRDLCAFVGADYAKKLDEAQSNGFAHELRVEPDGAVLLALRYVPMWFMILDSEDVSPEHREAHAAWVRGIRDSGMLRPVAQKHFPELFE